MNGRYDVSVDGHKAVVAITADGKGGFFGTIETPEYGTGEIKDGKVDGVALRGKVELAGHEADFSATADGKTISGTIRYGWFIRKDFAGTSVV